MENIEFGKLIRNYRKEQGLTLTDLGEKIGLSHPYLSQIELGKRNASPEILQKLATVLDVGYTELMIKAGYIKEEDVSLTQEEKASFDEVSYLMTVNELNTIENKLKQCDSEEEKKNLNARKIRLEKRIAKLKLNLTGIQQRRNVNPFDLMTPEEEEAYFERQNKDFDVEEFRRLHYPDVKEVLEQSDVYFNGKSLSKAHKELAIKMLDVLFEKLEVNYPSNEEMEKKYDGFNNMFAFLNQDSSDFAKDK
ncbi:MULTISPECIES: helix-turn-helix domain-containing protein [Bacillus]|uniref:helix-turn-helix domain-containing protein n=1 Tax=Bacillus TaxID=1386 RepID=UPI0003826FF6|nr:MULTISPECIES: helix-turn-helix domain-containing protein [Bacillus]PEP49727.1 transcriptional regulator [Bacillus pseudomycoides]PHC93853.1 transcriptional regulator [Bacillus pseudomycoides]